MSISGTCRFGCLMNETRWPKRLATYRAFVFHRCVGEVEAVLELRVRLEIARLGDPVQLAVDARVERLADGLAVDAPPEIREGDEPPVQPEPLAVGVDLGHARERSVETISPSGTCLRSRRTAG